MRIGFGQFGKIRLGLLDTSIATFSSLGLNPGTFVNSGVSFFGGTLQGGVARAAVNIGPPVSIPGLTLPFSLEVTGVSNFFGNTNQIGTYTCTGTSIFNGTQTVNGFKTVNGAAVFNASSIFNSSVVINAATVINGTLQVNGLASWTSSIVGITKEFDIPHPSKENHRLAHGCIEGPEFGVYFRGKSKTDIINLPDYWTDLVDEDTITVNLTSIGQNQNLYVEYIEDNQIKVGGGIIVQGEKQFNYHYTVFAERKDVDKLIVEYEGTKIMAQGGAK